MKAKRRVRAGNRKEATYKIGYGKPPKESQFKPGASGNRRGRRKGRKNRATILQEIFDTKISLVKGGKRRKVTYLEGFLRSIFDKALKQNDVKLIKLLMELQDQVEATERHLAAQAHGPRYIIIDETMTPREASEAYAKTLAAIPGMCEPNFEIDDSESDM